MHKMLLDEKHIVCSGVQDPLLQTDWYLITVTLHYEYFFLEAKQFIFRWNIPPRGFASKKDFPFFPWPQI